MKISSMLVILSIALMGGVRAQQPGSVTLPSTPAGKAVGEYISAFNGGDTAALRSFFTHHLSEAGKARGPVGERLARTVRMRGMMGEMTVTKLESASDSSIDVVIHSSTGREATLSFGFEPGSAGMFAGLMVRDVKDAGGKRNDEDVPRPERLKNDDAWVAAASSACASLSDADEFSGVVLLAKRDSILFTHAYGLANQDDHAANTVDTRFNLGSINKNFTSLAIYQLAAAGKLKFEDTVGAFLPDYPNADVRSKVTIRNLLEMTSGIGDIFGDRYESTPKEKLRSIRDFFPLFANQPLEFAPGTKERYSNGGYIVLGAIIEKITGSDYYSYVRDHIFGPAGMASSDWYEKNATLPNIARGYTGEPHRRSSNADGLPQRGSSAGGGYATAMDLFRYTKLMGNDAVTPAGFPARQGFGIAGGTPGVNAALESDPQSGYVIIVLSNYDPPSAEKLARRLRMTAPAWH